MPSPVSTLSFLLFSLLTCFGLNEISTDLPVGSEDFPRPGAGNMPSRGVTSSLGRAWRAVRQESLRRRQASVFLTRISRWPPWRTASSRKVPTTSPYSCVRRHRHRQEPIECPSPPPPCCFPSLLLPPSLLRISPPCWFSLLPPSLLFLPPPPYLPPSFPQPPPPLRPKADFPAGHTGDQHRAGEMLRMAVGLLAGWHPVPCLHAPQAAHGQRHHPPLDNNTSGKYKGNHNAVPEERRQSKACSARVLNLVDPRTRTGREAPSAPLRRLPSSVPHRSRHPSSDLNDALRPGQQLPVRVKITLSQWPP